MKIAFSFPMFERKRKPFLTTAHLAPTTPVERTVVIAMSYPIRMKRERSITTLGGAHPFTNQISS